MNNFNDFNNYNQHYYAPPPKQDNSFTFGLVAIITAFVVGFFISLPFAIIALVQSNKARLGGYANHNTNTARVLAWIALGYSIFQVVLIIIVIILMVAFAMSYSYSYYW